MLVWIITGLLGAGGIGFVALLFFAPTAAAAIGSFLKSIIETRVGAAILAATIGFLAGGYYMHYTDAKSCERKLDRLNTNWQQMVDESSRKFEQEKKNRSEAVAAAVTNAQQKRDEALAAQDADWQKKFDAWKKEHLVRCRIQEQDFQ